ncbi:MAG: hypothetical protein ABIT04_08520 [Novosphingobium sp.]
MRKQTISRARLKSQSLTWVHSALTALRLGGSGQDGMVMALHRFTKPRGCARTSPKSPRR